MTPGHSRPSQSRAVKVAGLALILPFAIVAFAEFAILERLIVPGEAALTAQNILAHTSQFRLGITCYILYAVGNTVLLTALYVILKPVNHGLALLASFFRLVYAAMWLVMAIDLFRALQFLGNSSYLAVFSTDQLQTLAKLSLASGFDVYYVGLLFYGLASTLCGWLWFKSNYIPKVIATFGVLASAWAVFCSLVFFVFPGFDKIIGLWWFDTPLGLFEIVTGFWLLIRGIRPIVMAGAKE